MRKAFYYDSAIPPENWLKIASLLWEKIWISPLVASQLSSLELFTERKNDFLTRLYKADTTLFDTSLPEADETRAHKILKGDDLDSFKGIVGEYIGKMTSRDVTVADAINIEIAMKGIKASLSSGDVITAQKLQKELKKKADLFRNNLMEKAELFHHGFYNYKFKELYPQLDYFFDKEQSFKQYISNDKEIILLGIEAILPINPGKLSITQIMDFRLLTKEDSTKFVKISEEILKDIFEASTEEGFNKTLMRYRVILDEKVDLLKKNYGNCKIGAAIKKVQILTLTVSGLSLLLPISLNEVAMVLSNVSLFGASEILERKQKAINIDKESWGFLIPLKQLAN